MSSGNRLPVAVVPAGLLAAVVVPAGAGPGVERD